MPEVVSGLAGTAAVRPRLVSDSGCGSLPVVGGLLGERTAANARATASVNSLLGGILGSDLACRVPWAASPSTLEPRTPSLRL